MKKFICAVLTFVLVLSLFVPTSFAMEDDYSRIVYEVEKTNIRIENLIDQAIKDVEKEIRKHNQEIIKLQNLKENVNKDIDKLIYESELKLEIKIKQIIDCLIDDTNKLAGKMIKDAAKVGIKVICEYIEVEIGNQKVLIDPLRVVGF